MNPVITPDENQQPQKPVLPGSQSTDGIVASQPRFNSLINDLKALNRLSSDSEWGSSKGLIGAVIKNGARLPDASPQLHEKLQKLFEGITAQVALLTASTELSPADALRLIRKTVFDSSFLASLAVHNENWQGDNQDAHPVKILEVALWNLYPKDIEDIIEKVDAADGDRTAECKKLISDIHRQLDPTYEYEPNSPSDFSLRSMLEYMGSTLESLKLPKESPTRVLATTWDKERLRAYKDLIYIEEVLKGKHQPPVETASPNIETPRLAPAREASAGNNNLHQKPNRPAAVPQTPLTAGIEGIEEVGQKSDRRSVMVRSGNTHRDTSKMPPEMRRIFERDQGRELDRAERVKAARETHGIKSNEELRKMPGTRKAEAERAKRAQKKPGR